jgi:hypothetical protein
MAEFNSGMDFIYRLRPVSFDWKANGTRDIGFIAEDVAAIDPTFTIYNKSGQVEGLKYDRLTTVFVNAFNQQQAQIDQQEKQLARQRAVIEALIKLACNDTGCK